MYNPFSLTGKTILITGASSGIGKEISIQCAKLGANLILTGRNKERLEKLGESLTIHDSKVILVSADLILSGDIKRLCSQFEKIDGLVNSAGIVRALPFKFFTSEFIDEVMNTNFKLAIMLTSYLVKAKQMNKSSSIVFISSISGNIVTSTANSIYCASKAAINGISKGIALELASQKIRVNTIMPGIVKTELLSDIPMDKEQMEEDIKKYPLGYGEPKDVALAAVYLLSDASKWMTGSNLLLDGGYTLL